jgi:hypothetical protein
MKKAKFLYLNLFTTFIVAVGCQPVPNDQKIGPFRREGNKLYQYNDWTCLANSLAI